MLLANIVAPDQTARMRRLIWGYTVRKCDKGPFLIKRLNYKTHSIKKVFSQSMLKFIFTAFLSFCRGVRLVYVTLPTKSNDNSQILS